MFYLIVSYTAESFVITWHVRMNQSKDFSACIEELLDQGVLVCRTNDDPSYCLSIIFHPYFCLDSKFQWQKFTDMNEQLLCRVWRHSMHCRHGVFTGQLFWSELWYAQEFLTTNFTVSWFETYFAVHSNYANLRFMATVTMLGVCEACTYSESGIPYHEVAILLWLEQSYAAILSWLSICQE